jgi:hypothetical protein
MTERCEGGTMRNNELVEIELDDGTFIHAVAEVDDAEREVGDHGLKIRLSDLLVRLTPLIKQAHGEVSVLHPSELSVTVKLGIVVKAGTLVPVIGGSSIEGALEVQCTWSNK